MGLTASKQIKAEELDFCTFAQQRSVFFSWEVQPGWLTTKVVFDTEPTVKLRLLDALGTETIQKHAEKTIEDMENDETWIGEIWMPKSKEEHEACFSFMSASNWVTGAVIWLTHCVCDFTVNHRNCLKVIFQVRLAELMCTFAPQTFLALKNWRRKNWTWKSTNVNRNKRA